MNTSIKFALVILLMLTSQAFFAQKIVTSNKQQQNINQKAEKDAKKHLMNIMRNLMMNRQS